MKNLLQGAAVFLLLTILVSTSTTARAQGTAFTYQGRLNSGTNAAAGSYDFAFSLYAVSSAGTAIAGPVTNTAVGVTNGLFTTTVDFGNAFSGASNWLQIAVSTNGANAFSPLSPRQQLTPVPYAVFASSISGVSVQQNSSGGPNLVSGSTANNISGNIVGATIGGGGATNYAGGGPVSNSVTASFATVSGGAQNTASSLEAFVGGGYGNTASAQAATVSGGIGNTASGLYATVPGGNGNTASGNFSLAAGHLAQAVNSGSFVWADSQNAFFTSTANDQFLIRAAGGVGIGTATPAKQLDVTGNASGVAAGGSIDSSVFIRLNNSATDGNTSSPDFAGIGFGHNSTRQAIVGGTFGNDFLDFYTGGALLAPKMRIDINGTVGIMINNVLELGYGVAGKESNAGKIAYEKFSPDSLDIVGAGTNTSSRKIKFWAEGGANFTGNVGIGTASPAAHFHVNGGVFETPVAAALFEVQNCGAACAQPTWTEAIRLENTEANLVGEVGMGFLTAPAGASVTNVPDVWIGTDDKASGNTHSFKIATQAGGGLTNRVFINGASGNVGIGTTTPAGHLSVATAQGTVNIMDGQFTPELIMTGGSADGALRLRSRLEIWPKTNLTAAGFLDVRNTNGNATISLDGTNGNVTCVAINITSDRNAKENFSPVNARAVLDKVASLPISEWQYKQASDARHIGPMAQDFRDAFTLGQDDKHISVVDEGGVALAAIQGLNEKLDEKDARIQELEKSVVELKAMVKQLAVRQAGGAN